MKYKMVPKIDKKTGSQVGFRFEFRRYNPHKQRNEPVLRDSLPDHIRSATEKDLEVVAKYCESKAAEENAVAFRAKVRAEWRNKYNDFDKLLTLFKEYQEVRAPNSYLMDAYYLEFYCFPYFLNRDANQVENWPVLYNDFREWLSKVKPLKWKKEKLSLNTQNKIVKALNRFVGMYCEANGLQLVRCPQHPRDLLAQVTAKDLVGATEAESIVQELTRIRPVSAKLFSVLINSGLRLNEALGLCTAFLIEGKIDGPKSKKIHQQLVKYGLEDYYGYICLESQPRFEPARIAEGWKDPKSEVYWPAGSVPRKPLKSRKVIDAKWYRYVPIFSKEAWNILAELWNLRMDEDEKRKVKVDPRNDLLFEGITASMFYSDLVKAFEKPVVDELALTAQIKAYVSNLVL